MEPLEIRITRLTPDQQQEVSDFVDFLLQKYSVNRSGNLGVQPAVRVSVPPVMEADFPREIPRLSLSAEGVSPDRGTGAPRAFSAPVQRDRSLQDEGITRDYLTYGDSEPEPPRPAGRQTDGRRPAPARESENDSSHLLDWVD